jgi:hypothetical protein
MVHISCFTLGLYRFSCDIFLIPATHDEKLIIIMYQGRVSSYMQHLVPTVNRESVHNKLILLDSYWYPTYTVLSNMPTSLHTLEMINKLLMCLTAGTIIIIAF